MPTAQEIEAILSGAMPLCDAPGGLMPRRSTLTQAFSQPDAVIYGFCTGCGTYMEVNQEGVNQCVMQCALSLPDDLSIHYLAFEHCVLCHRRGFVLDGIKSMPSAKVSYIHMPATKEASVYSPKIHPEHVKRLYVIAKKMDMPMTKIVNFVLAVVIEQLEEVEDFDDMIVCIPVRPEEPGGSEKM